MFSKRGLFVVRACPGSGKTYAVAARLANYIGGWAFRHRGIATISFTNAAWQEIENQVGKHFMKRGPVSFPHFLGTIDSFVNKFIFLPFGHLGTKCRTRPILVGEPHGPWTGRSYSEQQFDKISFNSNGTLRKIVPDRNLSSGWENNQEILKAKERLLKSGFANQEDASYFALKILETYPQISRALVYRFPMFMVDEAQDSSEMQMMILDQLTGSGLSELMLVGDPDQAIFEWHDARPELFTEKMKAWSVSSIDLNENRRSSQKICQCTSRISSLRHTSTAVSDDIKDFQFMPVVVTYSESALEHLIDRFKLTCLQNGIEISPKNVAVISRSAGLIGAITGDKFLNPKDLPWVKDDPYCKEFARGKTYFEKGDFKKGLDLTLRAFVKRCKQVRYCSPNDVDDFVEKRGFARIRKDMFALLSMMPSTKIRISDWVLGANRAFAENRIELKFLIKQTSFIDSTVDELFDTRKGKSMKDDLTLGTIHSIKGETFEAALVILKTKGVGKSYRKLLEDSAFTEQSEELRIVYVGITRPRKILMLAVPTEEDRSAWESRLFS